MRWRTRNGSTIRTSASCTTRFTPISRKKTQAAPKLRHVHISENDRGTPGRGHVPFGQHFKALRSIGYDDWLVIEAFGRALPSLAAATRVWRDFSPSPEHVYL